MHPSASKKRRYFLVTVFVGVALLLTLLFVISRNRITGTWFAENYGGIVVISSDGTIQAGPSSGTYRKIGHSQYEIDFSSYPHGSRNIVKVSRDGRNMTWVWPGHAVQFSKLSSKGEAKVDQTLEEYKNARIVRRWVEGKSPELLVIMPDGRAGFDPELLRDYLNLKHGNTIDALEWVEELARWTDSGEVVNSLSEIPGYADKPLSEETRPSTQETVRHGDTRGREFLQVITYRRLGGMVYLFECEFRQGMCTSVKRRKLGDDVGAAYHPV